MNFNKKGTDLRKQKVEGEKYGNWKKFSSNGRYT